MKLLEKRAFFAVLFVVVGFAIIIGIYPPSFHAPFAFDDNVNILDNPTAWVQALSLDQLERAAFGVKYTRPLSRLTLGLNYYFNKRKTFGYHVVNMVIHLLCYAVLYLFFLRLFSLPTLKEKYQCFSLPLAFICALVWAVHPIQTQAVTYIVQRMASMAGLFVILSAYLYIRGRESAGWRRGVWLAISLASAGLGVCSKENAATVLFLIAALETILFQGGSLRFIRKRKFAAFFGALMLATVGLAFLIRLGPVLDTFSLIGKNGVVEKHHFTVIERTLSEFRVLFYYLYQFVFPHNGDLSVEHDFSVSTSLFSPATTLPALIGVCSLIYLAWRCRKRYPLFSLGLLWFFIAHSIEAFLPDLALIFDHRMYIPSMLLPPLVFAPLLRWAYMGSAVGGLSASKRKIIAIVVVCVVVSGLCWKTYGRNQIWSNLVSLWSDAEAKYPELARVQNNLGRAYSMDGPLHDDTKAIRHLEKAIEIDPNYVLSYYNLASIHIDHGDYAIAEQYLMDVLRIEPEDTHSLCAIAFVRAKMGDKDGALYYAQLATRQPLTRASDFTFIARTMVELARYADAIQVLEKGLRLFPENEKFKDSLSKCYLNYGNKLARYGKTDLAIAAYNRALFYDKNNAAAYGNLMAAYGVKSDLKRAIALGEKALSLDPNLEDAKRNLAKIYMSIGVKEEAAGDKKRALAYYLRALKLNPENPVVLNNAAMVLLSGKKCDNENCARAIDMAKRAAVLTGYRNPAILDTLSMAYAKSGQLRLAIDYGEKAIRLAGRASSLDIEAIRARVAGYKKQLGLKGDGSENNTQ